MLPERIQLGRIFWRTFLVAPLIVALAGAPHLLRAQEASPAAQGADGSAPATIAVPLPKGKKLILNDGSFQVVREYHREGDRVRYYSVERSAWEEIPADLVNWDATQKAEAAQTAQDQELVRKLKAADLAARTADIEADSSYEVRPGLLLPDGVGLYALSAGQIVTMTQNTAVSHLDKSRTIARIATGVPLIPDKHTIEIPGQHAKLHMQATDLEFYLRTADGKAPDMELLHTQIQGGKRKMETMSTNMVGMNSYKGDIVRIHVWDAAEGLFRFTVEQALPPGEYALVESNAEGDVSLYIWDFGVDAPPGSEVISASDSANKLSHDV